jgi:rSAM/selenodomain-associated transferase 2
VPERRLSVSIIIPTLNEARRITELVKHAQSLGDVEVLVVDGGSSDGTQELARTAGARVIHAARGRGPQMDAGAAEATGDVFIFLHADTRLPEDAVDHVRAALVDPAVIGGNFYLRYVPFTRVGLALTAFHHLQRSLFHSYGGQSAIFVRREAFQALGGFGPWPVLEDRLFAEKLEHAGPTRHLPTWAETSARRFVGREWRAIGVWAAMRTLHVLRVPPRVLARLYSEIRD